MLSSSKLISIDDNSRGNLVKISSTIFITDLLLILAASKTCATSYPAKERLEFKRINSAIKTFYVLCKRYPNHLEELNNRPTSCEKSPYKEDNNKIKITDLWDKPYHYASPKKHKESPYDYDLHSYGEDGIANTADDINTWIDQSIWKNYYRDKNRSRRESNIY